MTLEHIAVRTGTTIEEVESFAAEFRDSSVVAVINYLEKRIANMRGDENPKYELEQIRRDLGTLGITGLTAE